MSATKRLVHTAGIVAGVAGVIGAGVPSTPVGRTARRLARRFACDVRYVAASTPGLVYRLSGRVPDPDVSDDILADRCPLEHRIA